MSEQDDCDLQDTIRRSLIRGVIIEWLGFAYSNERLGNPDYRDEKDVQELVESLLRVI